MTNAMVRIDPRLRARRIEVQRAEGRRRLRVVLTILTLAGVAGLGWLATQSPLLDVDQVAVEGIEGASAAEVLLVADVDPGTPLIDIDVHTVAAAVASLPWVETAIVERQWPNTVTVEVIERIPVARMPTGDGAYVLVDAHGVLIGFEPVEAVASFPMLAALSGGELGSVELAILPTLPLVESIPGDLRPWISSIGVSDEGATGAQLHLNLVGGATADLGTDTNLHDKLSALRTVLAGTDLTCLATIDLRVPDLTTVMRDPVCEATNAAADAAVGGA